MKHLARVVWNEGMHLAQHHFQAQNRYFEDSIHFALSQLFFKPYGIAACELDAEALRNGTVSLLHARGVMPDGLAFHIPDSDAAPAARSIRDLFSPTHESHAILLAIPGYRGNGANTVFNGSEIGRHARYVAESAVVRDETTGRDEKPISVGRKNFRLMLDIERDEDTVTLPIARVKRDGSGAFTLDAEYIPPCLQIGASERLMQVLGRLVGILDAKSQSLAPTRQSDRPSLGAFASNEVATFWLLHTMHASVAPLRHHLQIRRSRPEQVYTDLLRLAGALCTFAIDSHPRSLPAYDHDRLGDTFDALDRHIRSHLEIIVPTSSVAVPLTRTAPYLYTGPITDKRCFGRSRWFFGIRASVGDAALVAQVPSAVKVCSAKFTPELVRRAYPGLTLEHVPAPPPAIAPRLDSRYFAISTTGPCWETIVQTGEIGVYVPDSFPGAEIEVSVVVEGES
jgi:type VI secretion system protein ImpJ